MCPSCVYPVAAAPRLLLSAILALGAVPALAADLPLRGPLPPTEPLPDYDWSGASISLLAGQAWTGDQTLRTLGTRAQEQALLDAGHVGRVDFDTRGIALGGGVGYDWQVGMGSGAGSGVVIGAMTDVLYTDLGRTRVAAFDFQGNGIAIEAHQGLDYLGTVRGRLGYAFGPVLVYGTGGFAFGGVDHWAKTDITSALGTGPLDAGKHDGMEIGTAYGGGVELMATRLGLPLMPAFANLSVKVEYLHYDLGTRNVAISGVGPVFGPGGLQPLGHAGTSRFRTEGDLVKAGLSYRFSGLGF